MEGVVGLCYKGTAHYHEEVMVACHRDKWTYCAHSQEAKRDEQRWCLPLSFLIHFKPSDYGTVPPSPLSGLDYQLPLTHSGYFLMDMPRGLSPE